ncbi:tyrosine-type recombinase/integrase [Mammaliicoccus lentus]|uniref:tyrosine-type recombinase/integrase n=1 Tax=Mammaliicoccus lentus TaxID=42858 RepID=UPI00264845E5|nr:site-specific integrase [Mammaliicoccus lentus]
MWYEEFTNKHDVVQYRFYEKYKDPLTDKWKRVSVVMNKNGKQSQKEAQKRLNERIEEKLNDKTPSTLKTLTFHQACDEWFENYISTSGSKRSTIKTKRSKVNALKKVIDTNILINKIDLSYAQKQFNILYSYDYSHQVNKEMVSIFKHVFHYARRIYGLTNIEFLQDITVKKKTKTFEEIKHKRENYLELSDIKNIKDHINNIASQMHSGIHKRFYLYSAFIIEFQALNGLRIGELLAIQPHNIDFDNKTLTIDGTIQWFHSSDGGYGVKDTTKTDSSYRIIGLSDRSCEILRKLMLENKKDTHWNDVYRDRGFVFTNHIGNPLSASRFNKVLREAAITVGIKKKISSHTLRASHISLLSEQGVSLKAIMDRVGHSDHRTTLQIYTKVTEQMDKNMMNKLEKVVI